jgi:tetratricopeptide (TPR) repeat protein
MFTRLLNELNHLLADNEDKGFEEFRRQFLHALDRGQLAECQLLLNILEISPSPRLHREFRYHQAILYAKQRQFDRAETLLRELLDDYGLSDLQRARVLVVLVIQMAEQGQWNEAENFARQALNAYSSINDRTGQAKAYNNLAVAITHQVEQGMAPVSRLNDVIAHHQQAISLLEALAENGSESEEISWEVACSWHGVGKALGLIGDHKAALDAFKRYVAMCSTFEDPIDRTIGLSDMAALAYIPLGHLNEASEALFEAIQVLREHQAPRHLAEALVRRANLRVMQGQEAAALADYDEAIAWTESLRSWLTSPTSQVGYRSTVEFVYAAPLTLHLQQGRAAAAFDVAEWGRSRVLADMLTDQSQNVTPHKAIPSTLLERRQEIQWQLDQAYAEGETSADLEQSLAELDRRIELLDPVYAGLETMCPLTAAEVQARLEPDAVLLTFVSDSEDRLWRLLLSHDSAHASPVPNLSVHWLREYLVRYQLHLSLPQPVLSISFPLDHCIIYR